MDIIILSMKLNVYTTSGGTDKFTFLNKKVIILLTSLQLFKFYYIDIIICLNSNLEHKNIIL